MDDVDVICIVTVYMYMVYISGFYAFIVIKSVSIF